jgi:hypothetical protein
MFKQTILPITIGGILGAGLTSGYHIYNKKNPIVSLYTIKEKIAINTSIGMMAGFTIKNPRIIFQVLPRMYLDKLNNNPLLVKSITGGVMYGIGDTIAQNIEMYQGKRDKIDWKRLGVFTLFGGVFSGPIYHFWFNGLDRLPYRLMFARRFMEQRRVNSLIEVAKKHGIDVGELKIEPRKLSSVAYYSSKILADQLIFSSLYTAFVFMMVGLMNGKTIEEAWEDTKKVYIPTYIADCIVWPPVQLINFRFVPVPLQPLFVNTVNIIWNTYLSLMANGGHGSH